MYDSHKQKLIPFCLIVLKLVMSLVWKTAIKNVGISYLYKHFEIILFLLHTYSLTLNMPQVLVLSILNSSWFLWKPNIVCNYIFLAKPTGGVRLIREKTVSLYKRYENF